MGQDQRYELVSTLGRGGMAEVFLGWMHSVGGLRRKVAIKRILPELAQKQSKLFQQMFVDEARLAFQLEHDNIVRVYDVGQSASTFFIVMEYIEGMDLKTIMERMQDRGIAFPVGIAVYILLQVCTGLNYAHNLCDDEGRAYGLIHNDISPPNILIGRYGEVKIADFGLSDAVSNSVETPEGMIKGKFAYISPEGTINPPKITLRSDIFSLGIVLWEMLAGQRLFQRSTDLETFKAVKAARSPDLSKIRPDLPKGFIDIVHRALAVRPEDRYSSAEQFYLDLSSFATAMSIPQNRYDLCWLIDDLAGNKWTGFAGERVSEEVLMDLERQLGAMLPPGDADFLKQFVTGATVTTVDESQDVSGDHGDWVADVFDDLNFDAGDVVFKDESGSSSGVSKSKPEKVPVLAVDSKQPVPRPSSLSPIEEVSGLMPSARMGTKYDAAMRIKDQSLVADLRRQNTVCVVWALIAGILTGGVAGYFLFSILS